MSRVAMFVGNYRPGSAEWLAARADGLGGSEIAAVLGLSPFESRFALWHRKAGRIPPVAETDEMYWGSQLEDVVAAEFARRHPELRVRRTGMWRNRARPYQLGQPDRTAGRQLLECKTARFDDEWGEPGTDEIPVYYRAQVLWYLDTLGRDECHVAVLISGSDYREFLVRYDPADAARMRAAAVEFMASLEAGERPDIDDHSATYLAVRELHPDIDPVSVEVPAAVALPYLDALAAAKDAGAAKRQACARLADAMGTAQKATYLGEVIATRAVRGDAPPHVRAARGAADQHRSQAA